MQPCPPWPHASRPAPMPRAGTLSLRAIKSPGSPPAEKAVERTDSGSAPPNYPARRAVMIQCDWGGCVLGRGAGREGQQPVREAGAGQVQSQPGAGVGEVCGNPGMAHVPDHRQTPPPNSPPKSTPLGLSYPSCTEPLSVQPPSRGLCPDRREMCWQRQPISFLSFLPGAPGHSQSPAQTPPGP